MTSVITQTENLPAVSLFSVHRKNQDNTADLINIYICDKRLNNECVRRYNLTPDTEAWESAAVQRRRVLAFCFN